MRRWLLLGCAILGLGLSVAAEARQVDLSEAPIIRQRNNWHKGRFEVSPAIGVTLDNLYVRSMLLGLSAEYFPTTWLGVGVDFRYGLPFNTGLADDVEGYVNRWNDRERNQVLQGEKDPQDQHLQEASFTHIGIIAGAHLTLIPISGKFMLFDAAQLAFDFHFLAGGGYVRVAGTGDLKDADTFYPMLGAGFRLFILDFFGISVQVRDYIVKMAETSPLGYYNVAMDEDLGRLTSTFVRAGARKEWRNNWEITFGICFQFPTELTHEP